MKSMIKISLRNKLLFPAVVLIFLGVCLSTVISYIESRDSIEDLVKSNMRSICSITINNLSSWVSGIKDELTVWREQDLCQIGLEKARIGDMSYSKNIDSFLTMIKDQKKYFQFIGIADSNGNILFSSDALNDQVLNIIDKCQWSFKSEPFSVVKSEPLFPLP